MDMTPRREVATRDALPQVREVEIGPDRFADQSLHQARIRERFGVTVLAIARADGHIILNPAADTILCPEDRVQLFGLPEQIEAFRAEAGVSTGARSSPWPAVPDARPTRVPSRACGS